MKWLVIDTKSEETFWYEDFNKMVEECEAEANSVQDGIRQHGRWDAEDGEIIIISVA